MRALSGSSRPTQWEVRGFEEPRWVDLMMLALWRFQMVLEG